MNIEHFTSHPQNLVGSFSFGFTPFCQRPTSFPPVANIPVGDRDQFDVMTFSRPHCADSSGLDFTIVRVSPKTNDTQLAIVRGSWSCCEYRQTGGEKKWEH